MKTMQAGMPWDWETFPQFLDSVDRTPKGVNVMAFVPLAPLYMYVAGVDKAKANRVTDQELDEMCRILVEGWKPAPAGGAPRSPAWSATCNSTRRHPDGHRRDDRTRGRGLPGSGRSDEASSS